MSTDDSVDDLLLRSNLKRPLNDKIRRDIITALENDGYHIRKHPPKTKATLHLKPPKSGGLLRIGILSDTHLNNRKQQLTALRTFYKYADSRGVSEYLHAGDFLDGLHVHRDAAYGQFNLGFDAQIRYAIDVYPTSANGPTHVIEGNHDLWYYGNAGASPLLWMSKVRKDLNYLGHDAAFIEVGGLRMLLQHGRKGGSYAKSYKLQKIIEQMQVEERAQTHLAFFGHWHTDLYLGRYQGVFTWGLPCFQAQTSYERAEINKHPVIAGMVLEVEFTRDMKIWNVRPDMQYYEPKVDDY